MKIALSIAGFDPTGGAGLQEDLKVFRALGIYSLSAAAALTAQNTRGVEAAMPVESRFLRKQLDVLLSDITPDAVKIGMLYSVLNVRVVERIIRKHSLHNIVLDPVIRPSRGKRLAEAGLPAAIRDILLPLCTVVTPNLREAEILAGMRIRDMKDMASAAVKIKEFGPACVIITGGHLEGEPADVLYDGGYISLRGKRYPGEFHGTGCTFSSALAAMLARGHSPREAARRAKRHMGTYFARTVAPGKGMRLFNP